MTTNKYKAVAFVKAVNKYQEQEQKSFNKQFIKIYNYANRHGIKLQGLFQAYGRGNLGSMKLADVLSACQENPEIRYVLVDKYERVSPDAEQYCKWQDKFAEIDVTIKSATQKFNIIRPLETVAPINGGYGGLKAICQVSE